MLFKWRNWNYWTNYLFCRLWYRLIFLLNYRDNFNFILRCFDFSIFSKAFIFLLKWGYMFRTLWLLDRIMNSCNNLLKVKLTNKSIARLICIWKKGLKVLIFDVSLKGVENSMNEYINERLPKLIYSLADYILNILIFL